MLSYHDAAVGRKYVLSAVEMTLDRISWKPFFFLSFFRLLTMLICMDSQR